MTTLRALTPWLFASTLGVVAAACQGDFDLGSKVACVTSEDCIGGYVCVDSELRVGTCVRAVGPDRDATGGDAAGESDAATDDGAGADVVRIDTGCVPPGAGPEVCNGTDDDCDGRVDEASEATESDTANCGACGVVCVGADAQCVAGRCTIACPEGRWDRDGVATNGCEAPCGGAEAACSDGLDDDCDGLADARDSDCAVDGSLAGRRYAMYAWLRGTEPRIVTAVVEVDASGEAARVTQQQRSDVTAPGRGTRPADAAWQVNERDASTVEVVTADGPLTLRRSSARPTELLVGVRGGDLYMLVEQATPSALPRGDWHAWTVSPLSGLPTVPGGAAALNWPSPFELSVYRVDAAPGAEVGDVVWTYSETAGGTWSGAPSSTTSLDRMRFDARPAGNFDWLRLGSDGAVVRHFDGTVAPGGDVIVQVHRVADPTCLGRARVFGACMHDPILTVSAMRPARADVAAAAGAWTLIGTTDPASGLLPAPGWTDAQLTIDRDGNVLGVLTGTLTVSTPAAARTSPTLVLELRDPTSGAIVLEGGITPGGVGLFWRANTPTATRPLAASVYFLLRR